MPGREFEFRIQRSPLFLVSIMAVAALVLMAGACGDDDNSSQASKTAAASPVGATGGSSATAVEPNIVGTWQVHYHTHEFRYRFAPDHTVAVSGLVSGRFDSLWKGSWSVSGGDLLMELQPDSLGMGEQKPHWKLYGFQHDCFWIKDPEGIEYAVHRTE